MQKIPKWRGSRHFCKITVADVEAPGGEKWEHLKKMRGEAMASYL